jgi:hypothetical protein
VLLTPLLELGASVPVRGLFGLESELDEWAARKPHNGRSDMEGTSRITISR